MHSLFFFHNLSFVNNSSDYINAYARNIIDCFPFYGHILRFVLVTVDIIAACRFFGYSAIAYKLLNYQTDDILMKGFISVNAIHAIV